MTLPLPVALAAVLSFSACATAQSFNGAAPNGRGQSPAFDGQTRAPAARADIREELARLGAHLLEARGVAASCRPAGRRLQLLAEELDREADRLREKAQYAELTRLGLDLKTAIDQLREHIDNVE
uniref:endoribonuclease YicC domain-containing protein n=1 Tax=Mangrovicoccus ximenensis TaxID=1911570 RepID=UPI0038B2C27F